MKISYNWLKDYVKVDFSVDKMGEVLTDLGLEVEGVSDFESVKGGLEGLVVGKVLSLEKHPNADKLSVTSVDVNNGEPLQIVCGAPNVAKGQTVVVATVGSSLYPLGSNESFKIKKSKIRGVESHGMLCAEDEIGLGESHDGIMVLPNKYEAGIALAECFKVYKDQIFEIGLTPNRADAMGHIGVAQDVYAYCKLHHPELGLSLELPKLEFLDGQKSSSIEVEIYNAEKCPRYVGLEIKDVKIKESPSWLKNKLNSLGVKSINNIVDITNFVLWEYGQALHAFDADKISGNKVLVKTLEEGSSFTTLDASKLTLSADDLMICDTDGGMCMAGVYGGLESGVSATTKNIFLESAYFESTSIRRSSERHGLRTDAALRFEKGADMGVLLPALQRAALLMVDLGEAKIESGIVDVYPKVIERSVIILDFAYLAKMLGQRLETNIIVNILEGLDFKILENKDNWLKVEVPYAKVDVKRPADLVEEILRVYGFNNIALENSMQISLGKNEGHDKWGFKNDLAKMMVAKGLNEIQNNSLVHSSYWSEDIRNKEGVVDILNYSSSELDVLRNGLMHSSLLAVSHNLKRNNRDLKFFEYGKSYSRFEQYVETEYLSICIVGAKNNHWKLGVQNSDIYYFRKMFESVFAKLNLKLELEVDENTADFKYKLGEDVIAVGGTVKEEDLKIFDIKENVYFGQIDLTKLYNAQLSSVLFYEELNKYPLVNRDLSLLLEEAVSFEEVRIQCLKSDKKILKDVNLFDVYEGKGIDKGQKSYAINFTFENKKKTLTDKEVDKVMKKIVANLESELGAKLR